MMYQLLGLPLLPSIGGYIFITNFNLTKPRTYHYSAYKIVLYSALTGLIGNFLGSLAQVALEATQFNRHSWFLAISSFLSILDESNPDEVLVLFFLSISWILLNQLPWFTSGKTLQQAISDLGTPLEKLLLDAQMNEQLVSISLKNDEVYIGFIIELQLSFRSYFNQERYITILPIISGYQEAETKKFTITTRYYEVIYNDDLLQSNEVSKKDSHLTIPEREVITVSKFNYDVFQTFKISTES